MAAPVAVVLAASAAAAVAPSFSSSGMRPYASWLLLCVCALRTVAYRVGVA